MHKDFGRHTVHINRHYLSNWSLGVDYYQLHDQQSLALEASVLQVSLLFFNITLTRWHRWI